jgi:hypothetical protein
MSALIHLNQHNNLVDLEMHLGQHRVQVPNLRSLPQVANTVKLEVSIIVNRYTSHRQRALQHYGQLTPARAAAIDRIRARFGIADWRFEYLKPKILGIADDLILLLPHPDSRYYKNQHQLVADLIDFAHGFHATKFLQ